MANTTDSSADASDRDFVLTRVFDAPRALVFDAWTDPRHMANWWGPHGFTIPVCELDVRPGGSLRIVMRSPDGAEHPVVGVYAEIARPQRLAFTIDHSQMSEEWHDVVNPGRDRRKGKPAYQGLVTVTFDEADGKTQQTIRIRFESAAVLDMLTKLGMEHGWSQSLERLATDLAQTQKGRA